MPLETIELGHLVVFVIERASVWSPAFLGHVGLQVVIGNDHGSSSGWKSPMRTRLTQFQRQIRFGSN